MFFSHPRRFVNVKNATQNIQPYMNSQTNLYQLRGTFVILLTLEVFFYIFLKNALDLKVFRFRICEITKIPFILLKLFFSK